MKKFKFIKIKPIGFFVAFISSFVFVVSSSHALKQENLVELKRVAYYNVEVEGFVRAFKKVSVSEKKSVPKIVAELQDAENDYIVPLFHGRDLFKISYLLDNGWRLEEENSLASNLLETAIHFRDPVLFELVLRTIKEKHSSLLTPATGQSSSEKVDEILSDIAASAFTKTWARGHLLSWIDAAKISELEEGKPELESLQKKSSVGVLNLLPNGEPLAGAAAPPGAELESPKRAAAFPEAIRAAEGEDERGYIMVQVPYATNRSFDPTQDIRTPEGAARYFSYGHSSSLSYGKAYVTIPRIHERGELESLGFLEFTEDTDKHIILQRLRNQNEEEFFSSLEDILRFRREQLPDDENNNDIFVFIHGFNNDFRQAMRKTAQLMYDMNYPGVSLAFSWPARMVRVPLPWDFRADVERSNASVTYLKDFLLKVKEKHPHKQLHVVAHSLGTRVLSQTLLEVAKSQEAEEGAKLLGEVIFAAPAIDAKVFVEQWVDKITPLCERVSVLASDDDMALTVQTLAEDASFSFPLGLWTDERAALAPGVLTFDISSLSAGFFSLDHSTYSQVAPALHHMERTLRNQPSEADFDSSHYLEVKQRRGFFSLLTDPLKKFWSFK